MEDPTLRLPLPQGTQVETGAPADGPADGVETGPVEAPADPAQPGNRRGLGRRQLRLWLALGLGLGALGASGTAAALYLRVGAAPATPRGLLVGGAPVSEVSHAALPARVHEIA